MSAEPPSRRSSATAKPGYRKTWTPYCSDSSGRWWRYDDAAPAREVAPLLAAIDEDVTGIFWG